MLNVKLARVEMNLSVDYVAGFLGVNPYVLRQVEDGNLTLVDEKWDKLAGLISDP